MALAEALGLLQGVQQLQTWQVGRQAGGFGTQAKWSRLVPGTALHVSAALGSSQASVANNAQAQAQLGSSWLPYSSLEEALSALSTPSSAAAWAAPRTIYLGPGTYTVGAQVIRRSITFVFDQGASITDLVSIEASNAVPSGVLTTAPIVVQFICPFGLTAKPDCLPGSVDVSVAAPATRAVALHVEGMGGVVVTVADAAGGILAQNANVEIHAPAPHPHGFFRVEARSSILEGATLEASEVHSWDSLITASTITCDGTTECRLYSTELNAGGVSAAGVWTGGTLLIDTATDFDWTTDAWVKNNPGGVAPVIMV